jgi:hypothetical protein
MKGKLMYQILSEEEYSAQVKKMLTWGKTTLDSLEHDDLSITSQIMESSMFLGRVTADEAHIRFALEQKRSLTKEKLRQACNTNTATKAPSEAKLDSLVELDEDVQKLEDVYADLKGRVVVANGLYNAIAFAKHEFLKRNKARMATEFTNTGDEF